MLLIQERLAKEQEQLRKAEAEKARELARSASAERAAASR